MKTRLSIIGILVKYRFSSYFVAIHSPWLKQSGNFWKPSTAIVCEDYTECHKLRNETVRETSLGQVYVKPLSGMVKVIVKRTFIQSRQWINTLVVRLFYA